MTLLAPAALAFGLVLPAIGALYLLRPRRPDHHVSSILLWQRAARDVQGSVPWQRLRSSWLLLLQLAAAALLVAAAVRPALSARAALAGHTIVVVDVAASMQATDVAPSRFEAARAQVRDLIDEVGPDNRMTLIALSHQPQVVTSATGDRSTLRDGLSRLRVTSGGADLRGALTLALAAGGTGRDTRLILLSDGIVTPLPERFTLPFAFENRVVGSSGENLAITTLTVSSGPSPQLASVHVANLGRTRRHTTVEMRADGRLVDARGTDIEPGSGSDLSFAVPAHADHVTATLSAHDILAVDDSAVAVVRAPRQLAVQLVTERNLFLERALALRPDLRVTVTAPRSYTPSASADLYIFDGFLPASLPSQPYWVVAPPPSPVVGAGDAVSPGRPRPASADDPLLAGVDLGDVHVARTRDLRGSTFGRPLVESAAGPLVMVRDELPRAVLFGFDLHESDLPLRPAFPILVDRLSSFVLPPLDPPGSHAPGDAVQIPVRAGTRSVRVVKPDGSAASVSVSGAAAVDFDTDEVGLYTVSNDQRGGGDSSEFAVNVTDPARSAVAPVAELPVTGSSGRSPSGSASAAASVEIWPWLALAALVVLGAEWWRYHRAA